MIARTVIIDSDLRALVGLRPLHKTLLPWFVSTEDALDVG